jgi:hypothetical protein
MENKSYFAQISEQDLTMVGRDQLARTYSLHTPEAL